MAATYNAMTGDKDADAVCANGSCHGSHGFRVANALSNIFIASCLAVWYVEQCVPYLLLEVGAHEKQRDVEGFSFASKIFVKLHLRLF